jgi:hypothetical protein
MHQKILLLTAAASCAAALIACGGAGGLVPNCVDWTANPSPNPVQIVRGSNASFSLTYDFAGDMTLVSSAFPTGVFVTKTGAQQFRLDAAQTAAIGAGTGRVTINPQFGTMCQEKQFTIPFNITAQNQQQ